MIAKAVIATLLCLASYAFDRWQTRRMWARVEKHRARLGLDPIDPKLRAQRGLPPL